MPDTEPATLGDILPRKLGVYLSNLIAAGLPEGLAHEIVRDAAFRVHASDIGGL